MARQTDVYLIGDGVAAVIAWSIKLFYPDKPMVLILHGLDITFANRWYQKLWVGVFFSAIDRFIAISQATADAAISSGIDASDIRVIPNGIDIPTQIERADKQALADFLGMDVANKKILLTLGRLVKRKGVKWFLLNVMPRLSADMFYIIAGDGPERAELEAILDSAEYKNKAVCVGLVDEMEKAILLSSSDMFVSPNIYIPGDVEGFGIVVLEAGIYGLPVIGSDLQGLKDSIKEGENGWLVTPENPDAFVSRLESTLHGEVNIEAIRETARKCVAENFSWNKVIDLYMQELSACRRAYPVLRRQAK